MDEKESKKKKVEISRLSWIVTGSIFLVFAIVYAVAADIFHQETMQEVWSILCNAFFVPGILFTGMGGLSWIASEGSFDMLAYSFSRYGLHNLIPHIPKAKFEDFYEYKEMKDAKGRHWNANLLFVGLIGIAISIVFLIVYSLV